MRLRTLHIFAKAPVPGMVKTRLARTIGNEAACAVYVDLLAGTIDSLSHTSVWQTVVTVTPDEAATKHDIWPRQVTRLPQGTGDLGERMYRVLAKARHNRPVAIVGSDIPELKAVHIAAAFTTLEQNDLVFGPATDGGFWLIGASVPPPPNLFANVRWSTALALADTLANTNGLRIARLEAQLEDVDDADSYRRYCDRYGDQP